jgi:hypothetical protein
MKQSEIKKSLNESLRDIPVIDTHEHLPGRAEFRDREADILSEYLMHYFSVDLRSSGMSKEDFSKAENPRLPVHERWKLLEPWWENCRLTGYGRALDKSVQILYGVPELNRDTLETVNTQFQKTLSDPGIYSKILKTQCHIEWAVLDEITGHSCQGDNTVFKEVYRFDSFIRPQYDCLNRIEKIIGRKVKSLDDWLEALDTTYQSVFSSDHVIGIKCGLAYERNLFFPDVDRLSAEKAFREMFSQKADPSLWHSPPDFENFMMHYLLGKAQNEGRLMQIHTGILEGNGNTLANCDPMLLNNLFNRYDNIRFDLFHIGYPFQHKLLALVKMYPHVFADMCWTNIISPRASVSFLRDFIDSVPLNKVSAFGGDYLFPDAVPGHLMMAKENVAEALADCVTQGLFDEKRALQMGKRFFYDNPKAIFQI